MRKHKKIRNWNRGERVELVIHEVGASRAMYVDEETQRVLIRFQTTDNQIVEMELTPHQTAKLIEQVTMSYYAIVPKLKDSRGLPW